jgi:hypothetical protein
MSGVYSPGRGPQVIGRHFVLSALPHPPHYKRSCVTGTLKLANWIVASKVTTTVQNPGLEGQIFARLSLPCERRSNSICLIQRIPTDPVTILSTG